MRSRNDLASFSDVHVVYVALSRTLAQSRDAVSSHSDQTLRRKVLTPSAP